MESSNVADDSLDAANETEGATFETASDEHAVDDTEQVFAKEYTPTKQPAHALSTLPEDDSVDTFQNPTIEVSFDDAASPTLKPTSTYTPSPTLTNNSVTNPGLSPMMSSSPGHHRRRSSTSGHRRRSSTRSSVGLGITASPDLQHRSSIASNGSLGEFEDFQDGDADGGSDFGDFDDFEEGTFSDEEDQIEAAQPAHIPSLDQPVILPDIQDDEAVRKHMQDSLDLLLPTTPVTEEASTIQKSLEAQNIVPEDMTAESDEEDDSPFMLTDRAVSLWKQLTAPPPLQPPDWKRSRIRRLFLVSLGIPVDLDEILPKMTHKKLVLPSTKRHRDKKSAELRRSRKKIPPPPEFEITLARQVCATTREALSSMTGREREIHVATLKAHTTAASTLLTYWLEQRDAAKGEKETFEQVVSNLVQYHKKQKDEQKESATKVSKKAKSRFSMRG